MTIDELVQECEEEGCFSKYTALPADKEPVRDNEGNLVGFYTPFERFGKWGMGFLYIAKAHRRQGFAFMAIKHALKEHQDMTFHAIHEASLALAMKAGLTDVEEKTATTGKTYYVCKH